MTEEECPKLEYANNGTVKQNRYNHGLIYRKTEGYCVYCGKFLDPFSHWHMDHAIPKSQDGPTDYDNLWPSCSKCNTSKGSRTVEEYREAIPERPIRKLDELTELIEQLGRFAPGAPDIEHLIAEIRTAIETHKIVFYFEQEGVL